MSKAFKNLKFHLPSPELDPAMRWAWKTSLPQSSDSQSHTAKVDNHGIVFPGQDPQKSKYVLLEGCWRVEYQRVLKSPNRSTICVFKIDRRWAPQFGLAF